jgi:type IV pilus assembly protein PilQ
MRNGLTHFGYGAARVAVAVFCAVLTSSVWASAAVTNVEFANKASGALEIRLDFDGAPPSPETYTIAKPARLIVDMEGVASRLAKKKYSLGMDNAESLTVLEAQGRTRAVVNLKAMSPYRTEVRGQSLFIELGQAGAGDYLSRPSETVLSASLKRTGQMAMANAAGSIEAIDFKRGQEGEGMLIIDLSEQRIDVDVRVEGSTLKVDFLDISVLEKLQRQYDVVDFATPVKGFEVLQSPNAASITIQAVGHFDYLAYQTDRQYVISVKPLSEEALAEKRKEFTYAGESLSLNFQDIAVRSVLQLIADFTNLNLVASDTVTGNITLRLQNVPWDQALDLVLKTKGLDKRVEGNVLMIGPADEIAERERKEVEHNKQREELAPLITEVFEIRYADAKELYDMFMGKDEMEMQQGSRNTRRTNDNDGEEKHNILSERGNLHVDERTNTLIFTETPSKMEEIRNLIAHLDIPIRQVMIEARIVKASSDFSEKLGVQWGGVGTADNGRLRSGGGLDSVVALGDSFASGGGLVAAYPEALAVDLGLADTGASKFSIGYADAGMLLNLELSALESGGYGEVVSQPKVITGDKQEAMISSGVKIPYQTRQTGASEGAGNQQATITLEEAVLKLQVTPKITPDNRIIMDLVITQDALAGLASNDQPLIDTTQLETQVLVDNGETIVLGGVFQTEDINSTTKTPLLGDIPVVGNLFKRKSQTTSKTETLIFITPSILADALR